MSGLPKITKEELLQAITKGVSDALNLIYPSELQQAIHNGVVEALNIAQDEPDIATLQNEVASKRIYNAIKEGTREALQPESEE